ncbi:MAG TPA: type I DNA topoisomerase, partial [Rhizomicrobium sp.]|nr:type I DNA topoisomerase [Rhizomicrobium sp.]
FNARLTHLDGEKLDKLSLKTGNEANAAVAKIKAQSFKIDTVESKPQKRHPAPPFITSTLQQEASRKLGFGAKRTMQIAQQLYEGVDVAGETVGLITYMRTDGVTMDGEAVAEARNVIGSRYGKNYVPGAPRTYTSKAKNAQEAHEAVRPTSFERTPEIAARSLDDDQAKLYELIWKRAVASQMESAELERTTVDVVSADRQITFRATGTVTLFDGFLRLYQEGKDDESDENGSQLPRLVAGEKADIEKINSAQHFTEPPPRYSEASLVRKLEELGIGRPSTYASILSVLRDRAYVKMDRGRFVPDDKGRLVTAFLTTFFHRYVEYGFTADLEEKLDEVAEGTLKWKQLLRDFWRDFSAAVGDTKDLKISHVIDELNEILGPHIFPPNADGTNPRICPNCGSGELSLKLGRFGSFVGCSNYPECRFTRQLGQSNDHAAASQPRELGIDPATGEKISLRSGRFGPYVQLGEGGKPKRAGLPKGTDVASVDLALALKLLSLPREVGVHPETGKMITANFGRFGPYIAHDGKYASLDSPEDVFTVGLNRAVTVIAEKKANPRGRRGAHALKELGNDASGTAIKLMKGRYGPYVTDGTINATVPDSDDPLAITLEQASALLAERAAKNGGKKKRAPKPRKEAKIVAVASAAAAKMKPAKVAKKKPEPVAGE